MLDFLSHPQYVTGMQKLQSYIFDYILIRKHQETFIILFFGKEQHLMHS